MPEEAMAQADAKKQEKARKKEAIAQLIFSEYNSLFS